MENFTLKLLEISLTAVPLILAVLIAGRLCNKYVKSLSAVTCLLWGTVGIRLLLPFSIVTPLGLIPNHGQKLESVSTPAATHTAVTHSAAAAQSQPSLPAAGGISIWNILLIVWAAGFAAMLCYCIFSTLRLKKKLALSVPYEGKHEPGLDVRISENAPTPFIFGTFHPTVYMPSGLKGDTVRYVLAHEGAHLKRGDHIWKVLAFLILCLHWFNPFAWLAYRGFCRDMEFACDEKVFRTITEDERYSYAKALVICGSGRKIGAVCPVAFGESGIKERVKHALDYKKPVIAVTALTVLCAVLIFTCCATQRPSQKAVTDTPAKKHTVTVTSPEKTEVEIPEALAPAENPEEEKTTPAAQARSEEAPAAAPVVQEEKNENTDEAVKEGSASVPTPAKTDTPKVESDNSTPPPVYMTGGSALPSDAQSASLPSEAQAAALPSKAQSASLPSDAPADDEEPESPDNGNNTPAVDEEGCDTLGHDYYETLLIEPSCTAAGRKALVCTRCGDYREEKVSPEGHEFTEGEIPSATNPNVTGFGYRCVKCGFTSASVSVWSREHVHNYVNGVCRDCGKKRVYYF